MHPFVCLIWILIPSLYIAIACTGNVYCNECESVITGTKLVMVTNLSSLFLNLLFLSLNLDIWKSCSRIPYNMSPPQFSLLGFCRTNLSITILLLESRHMQGICNSHMYFEALKCFFVGDSIFRQTGNRSLLSSSNSSDDIHLIDESSISALLSSGTNFVAALHFAFTQP